ncbi:MAG: hypothetical protein HKN31_00205 [Pricia sp.]|nr:hypothetical protein [Pricia sp.]
MTNFKTYISVLILFSMFAGKAQENDKLQAVVEKGKSDLIEVLSKAGEQFNFGLNAEEVRNSQAGAAISFHEMNFEQLLNYDQKGIKATLRPEHKKIIPLVTNNRVVTTISTTEREQGNYEITDLINHQYHNELNELSEEIKQNDFKDLTIVYVPNLHATIYVAGGKSYTNYENSSLKEAMDSEELMQLLKKDATEFQRKYGDQIKDGKLLN